MDFGDGTNDAGTILLFLGLGAFSFVALVGLYFLVAYFFDLPPFLSSRSLPSSSPGTSPSPSPHDPTGATFDEFVEFVEMSIDHIEQVNKPNAVNVTHFPNSDGIRITTERRTDNEGTTYGVRMEVNGHVFEIERSDFDAVRSSALDEAGGIWQLFVSGN